MNRKKIALLSSALLAAMGAPAHAEDPQRHCQYPVAVAPHVPEALCGPEQHTLPSAPPLGSGHQISGRYTS
jgi:hypothetical protein